MANPKQQEKFEKIDNQQANMFIICIFIIYIFVLQNDCWQKCWITKIIYKLFFKHLAPQPELKILKYKTDNNVYK